MDKLQQLRDRLVELVAMSKAIYAKADAEDRMMDDGETKELEQRQAEFEDVKKDIARRETFLEQSAMLEEAGKNRQVDPEQPTDPVTRDARGEPGIATRSPAYIGGAGTTPAVARDPREDARHGFYTMGHFAKAVKSANPQCGGTIDKRLSQFAPTIVGNEGAGADGGFAVPPDFRAEIMDRVGGENTLLGMTDQLTSSSNQITVPVDETTAWQTSGGMLTFWEGENQQLTQSKPQLQTTTVKLNKLTALVPITDELMEDAPAMTTYLKRKVPQKIDFAVNLAIVQGNGVGKPLGILNSPCAIEVAKEGSQVADTVVYENILKMWNRMYGPYRGGGVWLMNQDVEPQLHQMVLAGASSDVPVWLPAGGISGAPFATLFGRPIIPTQACETLGDAGDIIFVNLGEYMTVTKGGIRAETSIHLWFDYDTTAFRFILRIGGQPWLSAAIQPRDGSTTYSSVVTLAVRS